MTRDLCSYLDAPSSMGNERRRDCGPGASRKYSQRVGQPFRTHSTQGMRTAAGMVLLAAFLALEGRAGGQTQFSSALHVVPGAHNHGLAGGRASLTLSPDQKELRYFIELDGLDLEPVAANRVDPEDVFGVHLHLIVPDVVGPHVLNIFGNPAEEDADLVVDFAAETFSGVFDASDATRDPDTGELLPQFFPLTTKLIDHWIDYLMADRLYLAVHTVGQGGGALLHGDVIRVPEPATVVLAPSGMALAAFRQRRSRQSQHLSP
jgi:hypothetical protein